MPFKKILGLFVDYDENSEKKEAEEAEEIVEVKETKAQSSTEPAPKVSSPPIIERSTATGETNDQIAESLANALEEANLEGFDYFEFAKVLDSLKEKMPSEQARFQAAFASSNVMGAPKDKLLETAQHYINVLQKEEEKFEEFFIDQLKRTVSDKEERSNQIDLQVDTLNEEIQKLTDQINDLTNEKSAINGEIIENRGKAEKVKNDFIHTLNIFLKKINGDIEKIQKYITE